MVTAKAGARRSTGSSASGMNPLAWRHRRSGHESGQVRLRVVLAIALVATVAVGVIALSQRDTGSDSGGSPCDSAVRTVAVSIAEAQSKLDQLDGFVVLQEEQQIGYLAELTASMSAVQAAVDEMPPSTDRVGLLAANDYSSAAGEVILASRSAASHIHNGDRIEHSVLELQQAQRGWNETANRGAGMLAC